MRNAKAINEAVKKRLTSEIHPPATRGWISDFVGLPPAAVPLMWGEAGRSLHDMLSQMDVSHPDLSPCLDEKLFDGKDTEAFSSLVGLAGLATKNDRLDLIAGLSRLCLFPSHSAVSAVTSKSLVRCMATAAQREESRRQKKPQVIDMTTISRKGEELWNTQPDSFDTLIRFEKAYSKEIDAAKRRAGRFLALGCKAMYCEVMKTVEQFNNQVSDCYMGFNRLTFNAASVVLAKWHQYNMVTPYLLCDFPNERANRITVPAIQFKNLAWNPFDQDLDSDLNWLYSPRVYPMCELTPTSDVRDIVAMCEAYSGYGQRPLFDHYAVMVPGIEYPPERDGQYKFRNEDGTEAVFEDQNEARFALDKALLAAGAFSAVVMGERDGKCYCLCVWS